MSRWYLDENDIDIYLKCTDDVRWNYNPKELVRILNDLETKLAEKDKAIENWQTMYESVMQTCHNDKEEIERLNKQLTQWKINAGYECGEKEKALRLIENLQQEQIKEMQEHQEAMELADKTITNLVEDNRASQEWYKKQLAEKDEQIAFWKQHHRSIKKSSNKIFRQAGIAHIQDKISFALEQLEKVKEFVRDNASYVMGDFASVWEDDLLNELDNQIKQLKEME